MVPVMRKDYEVVQPWRNLSWMLETLEKSKLSTKTRRQDGDNGGNIGKGNRHGGGDGEEEDDGRNDGLFINTTLSSPHRRWSTIHRGRNTIHLGENLRRLLLLLHPRLRPLHRLPHRTHRRRNPLQILPLQFQKILEAVMMEWYRTMTDRTAGYMDDVRRTAKRLRVNRVTSEDALRADIGVTKVFCQSLEGHLLQLQREICYANKILTEIHELVSALSRKLTTVNASSISPANLQTLRTATRSSVRIFPDNFVSVADAIRSCSNDISEPPSRFRWRKSLYETQNRGKYMEYLKQSIHVDGYQWVDCNAVGQSITLRLELDNLPFKVSAKNDASFAREGLPTETGSVVNFELKRPEVLLKKTEQNVRQAEAEFLISSWHSERRTMQVLTDLNIALLIYSSGGQRINHAVVLWKKVPKFIISALKSNSAVLGNLPHWEKFVFF